MNKRKKTKVKSSADSARSVRKPKGRVTGKAPFFAREQKKYDSPVPSREHILDTMHKIGHPVEPADLYAHFKLTTADEFEGISRRLSAMRRDGQIMQDREGRYAAVNECDLLAGWVQSTKDGFGFLIRDDGGADVFLAARQMRQVFSEDRVLVRLVSSRRSNKLEGSIVRVIERNTHQVVGRFFKESGVCFVVPYDAKINQDILIPEQQTKDAKSGQYVMVNIAEQPTVRMQAVGHVQAVLGNELTRGLEVDLAIASHSLPCTWNKEIKDHVKTLPEKVVAADLENRVDLRKLSFVTIDGIDAKDFDDAIYCVATKNGWRLIVAIADVGYYVKDGDPLDIEAKKRGTSVYFPGRVIPMLPEEISNGLCSLVPHQDRLVYAVEMDINKEGECIKTKFYDAVIHSHARLTYDAVNDYLQPKAIIPEEYKSLMPMLNDSYKCYKVLWRQREERGALDFVTQETFIVFDAGQRIEKIELYKRNDIHKLIESFMLVTNSEVAKFLLKNGIPALFREHLPPEESRVQALNDFLRALGLRLQKKDGVTTAKNFSKLLQRVSKRDDAHLIQTVLLRSLKQAVYSPVHTGHFGLAYEHYCQFTSPIRRYPDLIAHRALRYALHSANKKRKLYDIEDLHSLGDSLSMLERRADVASRDVEDWLKCHYMQNKLGEIFHGTVTKATGFGIFVELNEVYVEGLCHITTLPEDYYHFDQVMHVLTGKHTGRQYRIGDQVQVTVANVDLDQRKIDFIVYEKSKSGKKRRSK
jgi:ribonuclease R